MIPLFPARPTITSHRGTGPRRRRDHLPWLWEMIRASKDTCGTGVSPVFPPAGRRCHIWILLGALSILGAASSTHAQPTIMSDPDDDAVIRRTDLGGDGPIDPQTQRLPDIIEIRLGRFTPTAPHIDRFEGVWDIAGAFARVDIVLDDLINPPGPLAFDPLFPVYDPFLYGPNPIFGYIEFDLDGDENTGGELKSPDLRYLGNVARFSGLPIETRFFNRAAQDDSAFDDDITTAPFVDRSGEEFHIPLIGEEIEQIQVKQEKPGGNPAIFEEGETWWVGGEMFHRAHGFEDFSLLCFPREGKYQPSLPLLFHHDPSSDTTTISLVYPLQNAGSAALVSPTEPVQPNNGCAQAAGGGVEQNSIEEALDDLQFSATNAKAFDRMLPDFQLIAGWEFNSIAGSLDPATWRVAALVGTAFAVSQSGSSRFIWTDVFPNPCVGDFNNDGLVDNADVVMLNAFIALLDGDSSFDTDNNATNGSLTWQGYARNFSLFDTNYDGFVDATDAIVAGDMDLNQLVDMADVDDFTQALLDKSDYSAAHNGIDPLVRGDLDGDGELSGMDIGEFITLLLGP